ncbi:MFS transporter [Desulfovibrio ferrophilus]|uniref:Major facilitator superfamily MFS_1 n=1 Tax=Desulfovibrio ferrophilus TaxID=241368 RepID=A0A2Z6AU47_9BACT|nr:MFS transporter [Desulfovibrio ferrophilus]BBD06755.1 major facilitator superfamily MFS_1 [Desulfovibrio ferrophilus]
MPIAPQKLHLDRNLHILFGVTLIVVMGVSSIAPAFPPIMEAFGLTATKVAWLVTAFTLPGVFLTPVFGILADRHGRKKVLVPALVCFGIFGAACTLADSFAMLVGLRFLQGVGAASLGALNMTIISDLYSGNQRTQALGYNAGMLSLGTTLFPLLGGILAQFGWRWPFLLPLLALPLALAVLIRLQCPEPDRDVDFMEYMRLALKRASGSRALALFATTAVTFIILYGVLISFLPVYLAETFDAEPWAIGMIFASTSLATAIMSTQLGRLARVVPPSGLLVAAFVLYAVSAVLIPLMPSLWWVLLPIMIFGVAQGLNIPCVQTLLADLAPMEQRGAFMALNGTVLRVGQTLGPVVMGTSYAVAGYWGVFITGAVLALSVCVLVLLTLREG